MLEWMWGKMKPHSLMVELQTVPATLEISVQILKKLNSKSAV